MRKEAGNLIKRGHYLNRNWSLIVATPPLRAYVQGAEKAISMGNLLRDCRLHFVF